MFRKKAAEEFSHQKSCAGDPIFQDVDLGLGLIGNSFYPPL